MQIRKAVLSDLDCILEVYRKAREFMVKTGNPHQWSDGHPHRPLLEDDIEKQQLYVCETEGKIHAVFALIKGVDPTYSVIDDGQWPNDEPYGTIHRIASDGTQHGVLKFCTAYAKARYKNVRIDTHHDNKVMQNALAKVGFERCGIIYLANGDPRIAYQWCGDASKRKLEKHKEVERSIIKKYRKSIWNNFIAAVKEYELISEGDCIAVCISGGKDSVLMAKCMQQLCRHSEVPFTLKFIVMDPGYAEPNRKLLEENCKLLGIDAEIFENNIFNVVHDAGGSPCYLCARMRRGALYDKAKSLGCNKIALGHHFDDVIETVLMSMMYASEIKTMLPKLHSTNFEGMELIRPLYKVKERDIIAWSNYNELKFLQCACRFTEESSEREDLSKRKEMKALVKKLRESNPEADDNIFRSLHNVNMATIPGWRDRDEGTLHSFLENY